MSLYLPFHWLGHPELLETTARSRDDLDPHPLIIHDIPRAGNLAQPLIHKPSQRIKAFTLEIHREYLVDLLQGEAADAILDVGCHPGGWTQVSVEESGADGLVVGVDLKSTSPVEGASILQGDIGLIDTLERIEEILDGRQLNLVLSDISPKLTGRYDTDQSISLELSTMTLDVAMGMLVPGGTFVTKIFQGVGIEGLIEAARDRFSNVQRFAPLASRNSSSETYLVCRNRLPVPRQRARGLTANEQVQAHLTKVGVNVESETEEDTTEVVKGFRRFSKKDD